tara:strand:+ start:6605 stop:6898 length:294 start_codon:yes stop_codon:yes gene_type:complete
MKLQPLLEGDYPIYHKSFTSAAQAARDMASRKGYEIDEDEWFNQVSTGGTNKRGRPSEGKTTSFNVGLTRNGKPQKRMLAFQVYGMKQKYELNAYIT